MLRALLIHMLLFSLPFIIYGSYWAFVKRRREQNPNWSDAPLNWLVGIGLVLTISGLVVFRFADDQPPSGDYTPPRIVDGKIVGPETR